MTARTALWALLGMLAAGAPDLAEARPGDLDQSFGRGGVLILHDLGDRASPLVDRDSRDRIVIAGRRNQHVVVARLTRSGAEDRPFGRGGQVVVPGSGDDFPTALRVMSDGAVLVAIGSEGLPRLVKLAPDGKLDPSFGNGGVATLPSSEDYRVSDLDLTPSDQILAVTYRRPHVQLGVYRLEPDGSPDSSFGQDGVSVLDNYSPWASGTLVVAPGGAVFVSGEAIAKLNAAGQLDPSFADNGLYKPIPYGGGYTSLAVDRSGRIVASSIRCQALGPGAGCDGLTSLISPSGDELNVFARRRGWDSALSPAGTVVVMKETAAVDFTESTVAVRAYGLDGNPHLPYGLGRRGLAFQGFHGVEGVAVTTSSRGEPIVAAKRDDKPPAVIRFEVDEGPADADGDRVQDRKDSCPLGYARSTSGCAALPRSLQIAVKRQRTVLVQVRGNIACSLRHKIGVYRVQPGRDRMVAGESHPNPDTPFAFTPRNPGRFYALAKPALTELARCVRARSSTVKVG